MKKHLGYIALLGSGCQLAVADVVSGSSAVHDVFIELNSTTLASHNQLLQNAPLSLDYSDSSPVLNVSGPAGLNLSTDVGNYNLFSNVNNGSGDRQTAATTTLNSVDLGIGVLEGFSLNIDALSSNASITGDYASFSSAGGTEILNGTLDILGLGIINLPVLPTANYLVFDSGALSIVLNEQIQTGDAIESMGLLVNAVHISFNDYLVDGELLTGSIILGQSQAGQMAVNTVTGPAGIFLMLFSFIGMFFSRRNKNPEEKQD